MCARRGARPWDKVRKQEVWIRCPWQGGCGGSRVSSRSRENIPGGEEQWERGAMALVPLGLSLDSAQGKRPWAVDSAPPGSTK